VTDPAIRVELQAFLSNGMIRFVNTFRVRMMRLGEELELELELELADRNFVVLKKRQGELRDGFPESLGLRTHRALSWLKRAEREARDNDVRFIFL
jgi:hypothetical protein